MPTKLWWSSSNFGLRKSSRLSYLCMFHFDNICAIISINQGLDTRHEFFFIGDGESRLQFWTFFTLIKGLNDCVSIYRNILHNFVNANFMCFSTLFYCILHKDFQDGEVPGGPEIFWSRLASLLTRTSAGLHLLGSRKATALMTFLLTLSRSPVLCVQLILGIDGKVG